MGKSFIIESKDSNFVKKTTEGIITGLGIEINSHSDILRIQTPTTKKSIGVKEIGELINWTITKPYYAPNKVGIIENGTLLTTEAQNKLLKTLEEPPEHTTIIIIAQNAQVLLETILSRCILISGSQTNNLLTENILNKSIAYQMKIIEDIFKIKDKTEQREQINNLLTDLAVEERKNLLKNKDANSIKNIATISKAKEMIDSNVSLKLALENLIIQLQKK